MLSREQVRQGTVPDAPSLPFAPVGIAYRLQVTGSTRQQERNRDTNEPLDSYSVVVSGILQHDAQAWTKKGPVNFQAGQSVNCWFNSGIRTGALLKALDEAQSDLLDGGILDVAVVEERPPSKPGNDGLKIISCRYQPPQPGMARDAVAQGYQQQPVVNGNGYPAQPQQGFAQPQYQQAPPQQQAPAGWAPQPQPEQAPYVPPAQPQGFPQQQPQGFPQQPQAPAQAPQGFPAQGYPAQPQGFPQPAAQQAYEPAPQQPAGPPPGAPSLTGLMDQHAASQQPQQQPQG